MSIHQLSCRTSTSLRYMARPATYLHKTIIHFQAPMSMHSLLKKADSSTAKERPLYHDCRPNSVAYLLPSTSTCSCLDHTSKNLQGRRRLDLSNHHTSRSFLNCRSNSAFHIRVLP